VPGTAELVRQFVLFLSLVFGRKNFGRKQLRSSVARCAESDVRKLDRVVALSTDVRPSLAASARSRKINSSYRTRRSGHLVSFAPIRHTAGPRRLYL